MTTPIMGLDEWETNQAEPNVTVNESVRWLELFASNGPILDRDLTAPPGSPADGDAYIVEVGATGAWAGHDQQIALRLGSAWAFKTPAMGKLMYVVDEDEMVKYTADSPSAWAIFP